MNFSLNPLRSLLFRRVGWVVRLLFLAVSPVVIPLSLVGQTFGGAGSQINNSGGGVVLRLNQITFGQPVEGRIALPGERDTYFFTGTQGQRLYYGAWDRSFIQINATLFSPSGGTVWQGNESSSQGPFALPESGTYLLVIDGSGDTLGDYKFRIDDLAKSPVLPLGEDVTGTLQPGTRSDLFLINGKVGQRLEFKAVSSQSSQSEWLLFDPSDNNLATRNLRQDLGTYVFSATGPHLLMVRGYDTTNPSIDYKIRVNDTSEKPVDPIGLDRLYEGRIAAGQRDTNSLVLPAGALVYIDSQDRSAGSILVEMLDPDGKSILTLALGQDSGPYQVARSGRHTMILRGSGAATTGTYRFRLLNLANVPDLAFNKDLAGVLDPGLTSSIYKFDGIAGTRLFYDGLDADAQSINVRIVGPAGNVILVNRNSENDQAWFSVVDNGRHFLVFEGAQPASVDYQARLLRLSDQPALPLDQPVKGTLNPSRAIATYTLSGRSGDTYYFHGASANNTVSMWLYGPDNSYLNGAGGAGDFEYALPKTGLYSLVFSTDSATPLDYGVSVHPIQTVTTALNLGQVVSGQIPEAGDQKRYTFQGYPGQRIYFDGLVSETRNQIYARLFRPQGGAVFTVTTVSDSGPFTLTDDGEYTLVVDGNGSGSGPFAFRLSDLRQAPVRDIDLDTTYGTGLVPVPASALKATGSFVNQSLRARPDVDDWRQSQQISGQRQDAVIDFTTNGWGVRADVGLTGGSDANWENFSVQYDGTVTISNSGTHLYTRSDDGSRFWVDLDGNGFDQDGSELFNNSWGQSHSAGYGTATPPLAPGTYPFRIQSEEGTGDNVLSFVWDSGESLDPGNETRIFRLQLAAGQEVYFDSLAGFTGGNWYLVDSKNDNLGGANISGDFKVTIPRDGEYYLFLIGYSETPLSYSFRAVRTGTTTDSLTLGALVEGALTRPGERHLFHFSGVPGQRLYFDSLKVDYDQMYYRLTAPSGAQVFYVNAYSDSGPFNLVENGDYVLSIEGNGAVTGDYHFRMIDVARPPALPLTLDAQTGYGLEVVPAEFLKVTGSYVNSSLRTYAPMDDWRKTQTIAGHRQDPQINFPSAGWGERGSVGLTGGTDANWENFSVQWDGTIRVPNGNTHLYTASDDGSRMWVDYNHDALFDTNVLEFVNNNWGNPQSVRAGPSSAPLSAGVYDLRVQYEEGGSDNQMFLLWDRGVSLDPGGRAEVYRFDAVAGQHLYFQSLGSDSRANWYCYGPANEMLGNANLVNDFELTISRSGQYLLVLTGSAPTFVPYGFRVHVFQTPTFPVTLNVPVKATLKVPGEQHRYTFQGTVGQRVFFDSLLSNPGQIQARLVTPSTQTIVVNGNVGSDYGPVTLVEQGIYTLVIDGNADTTGDYAFRLVEISRLPEPVFSRSYEGTFTPPEQAVLFQLQGVEGRRLYFDALVSNTQGSWYLYGPDNAVVQGVNLSSDMEVTLPATGPYLLVLYGSSATSLPYAFRILAPDTVDTAPTISSIPDQVVAGGQPTKAIPFTVSDAETPAAQLLINAFSSNPNLVPQNGIVIGGTDSARTATVTPISGQVGSALITIRVRDALGNPATTSFVLVVSPQPPRITLQPVPVAAGLGDTVTFRVVADGTAPLNYQWQRNGNNIPGEVGRTLTISDVKPGDAGVYAVAVSSPYGAVNSSRVRLSLQLDPLPFSDNFANAGRVSDVIKVGTADNSNATREPNEPVHAGKNGGKSLWLAWTAPGNGIVRFTTVGSSFDTLLAAYTGTALDNLQPIAVDDDHGKFFTSQIDFSVEAGTTYFVAVDGVAGASGNIIFAWAFEVTPDILPQFLKQPVSQTVTQGADVSFSVQTKRPNLAFQWFHNGKTIANATGNTLTIQNVQLDDVGEYTVLSSSGNRSILSQAAFLQVNVVDGVSAANVRSEDKFSQLLAGGAGPQLASVRSRGGPRLSGSLARGFSGSQVFSTFGATKEIDEPNHCDIVGGASQWFAYQAPGDGVLTLTTDGSDFDTVMEAYTGPGTDFVTLVSVGCDNDNGANGHTSRVIVNATAETIYYVAVDGVNAETGTVQLNYLLERPAGPVQLTSLTVDGGGFKFRLTGPPSKTITLQVSSDLLNWTVLQLVPSGAGTVDLSDPNSGGTRFYRAVLSQ